MKNCWGHVLALFAGLCAVARCEVFTALATLTDALHREKALAHGLRQYVELEKERLQKVLE